MKVLIITSILCVFSNLLIAQNITGRWQAGSPFVSAAYNENYQFFSDGTFYYNTPDDDGLTRVLTIGGKYNINKNNLILVPEFYIELYDGKLTMSGELLDNNNWAFDGQKTRKINLDQHLNHTIKYKLYALKGTKVLELNIEKFYRITDDPNTKKVFN